MDLPDPFDSTISRVYIYIETSRRLVLISVGSEVLFELRFLSPSALWFYSFVMRRHSPQYFSPPRRGYGVRGRSPPRRGYSGYGGRREHNNGSLLVRNVPMNCRPEDLRAPFERFGPVRDVYLPKDYYSGEPRGFAFVQFVDPSDATEAQYQMNGQLFGGREITVVVAAETRKRPEDMSNRSRHRGSSGYDGRQSSYHRRSQSRSVSRPRSPRYASVFRSRYRSRSYSPAPRQRGDYSVSPRRHADNARLPRDPPRERDDGHRRRSYSPGHGDADQNQAVNGYGKKSAYDSEAAQTQWRSSPGRTPVSPTGSRSRSSIHCLMQLCICATNHMFGDSEIFPRESLTELPIGRDDVPGCGGPAIASGDPEGEGLAHQNGVRLPVLPPVTAHAHPPCLGSFDAHAHYVPCSRDVCYQHQVEVSESVYCEPDASSLSAWHPAI
ncbi:hypothetical protein HHK36_033219 [Tetracentron sinense]|uniref:RRM domain-containing protein n=1 Tax=Tetracentron sinense TaxID=13715 RepID=A0A835CZQ9_TETSI|nr:hypothetical protein HHK36_033219 [Tetracentron sinense]